MNIKKGNTIYIKTKDYTLTNEEFELYYNEELDLLFTKPIPVNLEEYYESDDYISHTDSKKSLTDKIYQYVKSYSLKQKLKLINSFNLKNKELLDIGAGTGDFINICKNNGWNVTGIEPSKKANEIASTKNLVLKRELNEIEGKQYDVITMWHVLEHIPNLETYILKLKKLLKENGVLIVAVPNYKSFDANHYKQFWAAYDVPRHLWHFSKTAISKIFSTVAIKVEKEIPMKFDSYYVSLLSEKYKKSSLPLFKAFYIGFKSNFKAMKTKEYSSLIYILKNDKN